MDKRRIEMHCFCTSTTPIDLCEMISSSVCHRDGRQMGRTDVLVRSFGCFEQPNNVLHRQCLDREYAMWNLMDRQLDRCPIRRSHVTRQSWRPSERMSLLELDRSNHRQGHRWPNQHPASKEIEMVTHLSSEESIEQTCTDVMEPFFVVVMRSCMVPMSVARVGW